MIPHKTSNNVSKVEIMAQSAKADHFQDEESRHGYLVSMIKAANAQERLKPFTDMDLKYANYHLHKDLMKELNYQYPED